MILDDIGDYLEDQDIGTVGTDIFLGHTPATAPVDCTTIYNYPGAPPWRTGGGIVVEDCRIQIKNRAASYEDAMDAAYGIYKLLDAQAELTLGTTRYLWIESLSTPGYLGKTENNAHEIVCNYRVLKELTA